MSALDDYMSKDDNTSEEYEAALAELAQLRDKVDELVTVLKDVAICNNNGDSWNPYSPFAVKISRLTGVPIPGSDEAP